VAGHPEPCCPALIASLRMSRACVSVGPPFAASGPSNAFPFHRSVSDENPQLVPLSSFPPPEVMVPKQSWPVGRLAFATNAFLSSAAPPLFEIPAPARPDELR
jgi:hypothetical protein